MKLEENSKKLLKVIFFSIAVIIVMLAIGQANLLRDMERVLVDLRFRMRRSVAIDPKVSLVLVDSTAMDRYGYPVPRQFYARVTRSLCDNGASAVAIDRTFESMERSDRGAVIDELAFILNRYSSSVIPAWHSPITDHSSTDPPVAPIRFALPHKIDEIGMSPHETSVEPEKVSLPYYKALQKLEWLGAVSVEKASANRVEKIPLILRHGDRIYPALSLVTACVALNVDLADIVVRPKRIFIPTENGIITIPTDEKGQVRVNYVGGRTAFLKNKHSLARVYDSMLSDDEHLPMESFRDKIVLIGNDDIMGTDMHTTPFGADLIPGVAIHATIVSNILQRQFIDTVPWYFDLIVLIFAVICISYLHEALSPRDGLICLVVLLALTWGVAIIFFQFSGSLMNLSMPTLGGILTFVSTTFYSYVSERRRVGHIKQVFGKHVSQEIMDRLVLEKDGQVPMTERMVTALFVDITDHSRWAGNLGASQFAKELNECLEAMAQAVFENGGTINIFLGDGLLAIYNAPVEQDSHALLAVKTGLDIQQNISKLNEKRAAQNKHSVAVRVGINTGIAMAGTLGSKERLEYTVVGDTINMASRTEGQCEPGKVAITDAVVHEVGELVEVEAVGLRSVKGKEDGLMLYHVVRINENSEMASSVTSKFSTLESD